MHESKSRGRHPWAEHLRVAKCDTKHNTAKQTKKNQNEIKLVHILNLKCVYVSVFPCQKQSEFFGKKRIKKYNTFATNGKVM